MKRTEEGGYDTWGVKFPDGKIREFSTLDKATMYITAMIGKDVVMADGSIVTLTGLNLVHRYIPEWKQLEWPQA